MLSFDGEVSAAKLMLANLKSRGGVCDSKTFKLNLSKSMFEMMHRLRHGTPQLSHAGQHVAALAPLTQCQ